MVKQSIIRIVGYLKTAIKWLFRQETLSNARFATDIAKAILSSSASSNRGAEANKSKKILDRLEEAQDWMDRIQKFLPNKTTKQWVDGINKSENSKTWKGFSATLVKDKPGYTKGNYGINLGFDASMFGLPFSVKYDPKDGSVKGQAGSFSFGE